MAYKKTLKIAVLIIGIIFGLFACDSGNESANNENKVYKTTGIVKAINLEKSEITIDHKEIPGLMSAMTMDFSVADKKLLESAKVGEKIEFELEKKGSDMVITKIKKIGEAEKVIAGSEIYKTNCAECHGEKGDGVKDKGISFLKGHALEHSEKDFIKRVNNGEEDEMPAFKDKLTEEEIAAVVKYVRETIQSGAEKPKDSSHKH